MKFKCNRASEIVKCNSIHAQLSEAKLSSNVMQFDIVKFGSRFIFIFSDWKSIYSFRNMIIIALKNRYTGKDRRNA